MPKDILFQGKNQEHIHSVCALYYYFFTGNDTILNFGNPWKPLKSKYGEKEIEQFPEDSTQYEEEQYYKIEDNLNEK